MHIYLYVSRILASVGLTFLMWKSSKNPHLKKEGDRSAPADHVYSFTKKIVDNEIMVLTILGLLCLYHLFWFGNIQFSTPELVIYSISFFGMIIFS